jgi:hypothetical protein
LLPSIERLWLGELRRAHAIIHIISIIYQRGGLHLQQYGPVRLRPSLSYCAGINKLPLKKKIQHGGGGLERKLPEQFIAKKKKKAPRPQSDRVWPLASPWTCICFNNIQLIS